MGKMCPSRSASTGPKTVIAFFIAIPLDAFACSCAVTVSH